MGLTRVKSKITLSEEQFSFVILYLGHHHVIGHAFDRLSTDTYRHFVLRIKSAFDHSNLSEVIELLKEFPGQKPFSFFDMFKDEQIKLLRGILDEQLALAADSYRKINDRNYNLMNVMRATGLEVPDALRKNLELVLNSDLQDLFEDSDRRISVRKLTTRVQELKKWQIELDTEKYTYMVGHRLKRLAESLPSRDNRPEAINNIREVLEIVRPLGISPGLNELQNTIFQYLLKIEPGTEHTDFNQALIQLSQKINLDVEAILARRGMAKARTL
jgi:hypothetical protein